MENNEIMENEVIMENEETTYNDVEVSEESKGRGPVIAVAAVGAAALAGAGVFAYKKLIKPNVAKAKIAIAERKVRKQADKIEKEYTQISGDNEI